MMVSASNRTVLSRLSFRPPLAGFPRRHEIFNVPQAICAASRHRSGCGDVVPDLL
jgi:hypothetical protein